MNWSMTMNWLRHDLRRWAHDRRRGRLLGRPADGCAVDHRRDRRPRRSNGNASRGDKDIAPYGFFAADGVGTGLPDGPCAVDHRRGGCPHPPGGGASRADIESALTHVFSVPHAAIPPQNHSPPPTFADLHNNNYLQLMRGVAAGASPRPTGRFDRRRRGGSVPSRSAVMRAGNTRPYGFLSLDRRRGGFHIRPPRMYHAGR